MSDVNERHCAICGNRIMHRNHTHKTCGAPACTREQSKRTRDSNNRGLRERKRREKEAEQRRIAANLKAAKEPGVIIADTKLQARIIHTMRMKVDGGQMMSSAVLDTAELVGETPAVVLSIWQMRDE